VVGKFSKNAVFLSMTSNKDQPMNNNFRWPVTGDQAFKIEYRSWGNAEIEKCAKRRLYLMTAGYKLIADQAVDQVIASRDPYARDTMVYPIFFNYRHFIEISLKAFIDEFSEEASVPVGKKDHRLMPLWKTYCSIFDVIIGSNRDTDAEASVKSVISEFDKFDPNSFAMRYSTDPKGKQIVLPHVAFELTGLKDVMESVGNFFDGSLSYVMELVDASDY
jgi:hypothetical protein